VTYTITPASVNFSIWDTTDTTEYVSGTLATNTLYIYFGGPIVFAGITGNLTGITTVTPTPTNASLVALETAGQGSVLLTLGQNIDPYLDTATATAGDLSGSVTVSVTPEPATLALTGLGIMALFIRRKK
jgi:L-cystine uptake protein TcyP (sodium:dicarboxylate symporter family)